MKQLTCKMCGSTELLKQEGVFVCQTCGTKYSVEDAKKLVIEGTVNVGGTVKIDESDKISKYMHLAITALNSKKYSECVAYCNKILEIDNKIAKVWMFKGLAAIWQSSISNIRMNEFKSCAINSFTLAKTAEELSEMGKLFKTGYDAAMIAITHLLAKNVGTDVSNWEEDANTMPIIMNLYADGTAINIKYLLARGRFSGESVFSFETDDTKMMSFEIFVDRALELWNGTYHKYISKNPPYRHDYETTVKLKTVSIVILSAIIPKTTDRIKEEEKPLIIKACKNYITICEQYILLKPYRHNGSAYDAISTEQKKKWIDEIDKCHNIIKYCDPSYVIPVRKTSGCYVATCVYGSYDCPQVWTLRRYRDDTLGSTWYGRLFIRTYYAISPTLVKWFGNTNWFKKLWKGKLDRMVAKLQAEGVENTPYEDKRW